MKLDLPDPQPPNTAIASGEAPSKHIKRARARASALVSKTSGPYALAVLSGSNPETPSTGETRDEVLGSGDGRNGSAADESDTNLRFGADIAGDIVADSCFRTAIVRASATISSPASAITRARSARV
jgi:hypothetical protein